MIFFETKFDYTTNYNNIYKEDTERTRDRKATALLRRY